MRKNLGKFVITSTTVERKKGGSRIKRVVLEMESKGKVNEEILKLWKKSHPIDVILVSDD